MIFRIIPSLRRTGLVTGISLSVLSLAACAEGPSGRMAKTPDPVLPTEQYPLRADIDTNAVNLRVNPNGLSENQRRALDQLASRASWIDGEPVTLEIITSSDPSAISTARAISAYLIGHRVSEASISSSSRRDQPDDVVTINVAAYQAHVYNCNQTWQNLAATASNTPYKNFGCATSANIAAQIADPRDLDTPAPPTSADATRRTVVLEKYRKGDKTGAETDDSAKGTVSQAIN